MIKVLLQRATCDIAAYTAATVVILLAIALGLFRLFLPRLPEYQEDIKVWASTAIGMEVQFSGMDARWGLRGPEVEFYEARAGFAWSPAQQSSLRQKRSVSASHLSRIVNDRKAVVDRVIVRKTARWRSGELEDGQWWVQGSPPDQLLPARPASDGDGQIGRIEVIGEDLTLLITAAWRRTAPRRFKIPRLSNQPRCCPNGCGRDNRAAQAISAIA